MGHLRISAGLPAPPCGSVGLASAWKRAQNIHWSGLSSSQGGRGGGGGGDRNEMFLISSVGIVLGSSDGVGDGCVVGRRYTGCDVINTSGSVALLGTSDVTPNSNIRSLRT